MFKLFLVVALCLSPIAAQFDTNGTCPDFGTCRTTVNLTDDAVTGIWYQYASVPYFFQAHQKCTYFEIVSIGPHQVRTDIVEYNTA